MPKKTKKSALPPSADMVVEVMKTLVTYTKKSKLKCEGQMTVERRGDSPTVIMYATYPNGDYLCWFNDGTRFRLFALVNESFKQIMESRAEDLPKLLEAANELRPSLGLPPHKRSRA